MRVQLYLTRTVEQYKRVFGKFLKLINEPVYVLYQVLHAIDKSTVWSKVFQLLHVLKRDEVANVNIAFVLEHLCSRI